MSNHERDMKEQSVKQFWEQAPVGENIFGRLQNEYCGDYEKFFSEYDAKRYRKHRHLLRTLDRFDWRGKKVLEIGLGQGADSEQIIRRGARWSGIDLTPESVSRVSKRLSMRNLRYDEIACGSARKMPFPSNSFDAVYSHGVLHHIPEIKDAQAEIRRVLKTDGRLIVMLYARNSLNYQLAIKFVRRIGLLMMHVLPIPARDVYLQHRNNAAKMGIWKYIELKNFIHSSTDGPNNPYSKVYDRKSIRDDFPDFVIVETFKRFMHAPPFPVQKLPGESLLGWHLWAILRPLS